MRKKKNKKPLRCKIVLRLPDLDHAKSSVHNEPEFTKFGGGTTDSGWNNSSPGAVPNRDSL